LKKEKEMRELERRELDRDVGVAIGSV